MLSSPEKLKVSPEADLGSSVTKQKQPTESSWATAVQHAESRSGAACSAASRHNLPAETEAPPQASPGEIPAPTRCAAADATRMT